MRASNLGRWRELNRMSAERPGLRASPTPAKGSRNISGTQTKKTGKMTRFAQWDQKIKKDWRLKLWGQVPQTC